MSRAAGNIVARANGLFFPRQVRSRLCFSSGSAAEVNLLQKEKLLRRDNPPASPGRVMESYTKTKTSCWVPDPRTGIYFPVGHEVVMEGIPEKAARLGHNNVWVRTVDSV